MRKLKLREVRREQVEVVDGRRERLKVMKNDHSLARCPFVSPFVCLESTNVTQKRELCNGRE